VGCGDCLHDFLCVRQVLPGGLAHVDGCGDCFHRKSGHDFDPGGYRMKFLCKSLMSWWQSRRLLQSQSTSASSHHIYSILFASRLSFCSEKPSDSSFLASSIWTLSVLEVCGLLLVNAGWRSVGSIEMCFLSWGLLSTFREMMLAGIEREI